MSISIRQAFKNVFSEKYNKPNILIYVLLFFLMGVCSIYMPSKEGGTIVATSQNISTMLIACAVYFVLAIITSGFYYLAVNNGINKKRAILPDVISDFSTVFFTGIKCVFGMALAMIIIFIIPAALIFPMSMRFLANGPGLSNGMLMFFPIFGLIYSLFIIIVLMGVALNFMQNLKFSDWFKWGCALKFIKKTWNRCSVWILKNILLTLSFAVIFIILFVILGAALGLAGNSANNIASAYTVIGLTVFGVLSILQIDLVIQFLSEFRKLPKQQEN